MRFSCPSCSTKYNIADEKIANKAAKVRCKKCGTIFKVQGGATSAKSIEKAAWFVIVDRKQLGPMLKAELIAKIGSGLATADSYCWKPGFKEWIRVKEASELAVPAASPSAAPPQPPTRAKQPAAPATSQQKHKPKADASASKGTTAANKPSQAPPEAAAVKAKQPRANDTADSTKSKQTIAVSSEKPASPATKPLGPLSIELKIDSGGIAPLGPLSVDLNIGQLDDDPLDNLFSSVPGTASASVKKGSVEVSSDPISGVIKQSDGGPSSVKRATSQDAGSQGASDSFFGVNDDLFGETKADNDDVVTAFAPGQQQPERKLSKKALKDLVTEFSVMIRLNRSSQRRMVVSIVALIVLAGLAVGVIYLLDVGKKEPERRDSYQQITLKHGTYSARKKPRIVKPPIVKPIRNFDKLTVGVKMKATVKTVRIKTPRTKHRKKPKQKLTTSNPKVIGKRANTNDRKQPLAPTGPDLPQIDGVEETKIKFASNKVKKLPTSPIVSKNSANFNDDVKRIVGRKRRSLVSKCARTGALVFTLRIDVNFRINPDGSVSGIQVRGKNLDQRYSRCMRRRIEAWRFPSSVVGKKHGFSLVL